MVYDGKMINLAIAGEVMQANFVSSNAQIENYLQMVLETKKLSVGENSTISLLIAKFIIATLVLLLKIYQGLDIINLDLENCKIGLAAYQKKPEFGSGNISALNVKSSI